MSYEYTKGLSTLVPGGRVVSLSCPRKESLIPAGTFLQSALSTEGCSQQVYIGAPCFLVWGTGTVQ
jgi:hypothetical protein